MLLMGMPQISSTSTAEDMTASVCTFLQASPQNAAVSNFDMTVMHDGCLGNWMQMDMSKNPDVLDKPKAGKWSKQRLMFHYIGQNDILNHKRAHSSPKPVVRIEGVEPKPFGASVHHHDGNKSSSTGVRVKDTPSEASGSLGRKRLLPPSSGVFVDQLNGDSLGIGQTNYHGVSGIVNDSHGCLSPFIQDNKRPHVVNFDDDSRVCSSLDIPTWKNSSGHSPRQSSTFLADGPLLENTEVHFNSSCISSARYHQSGEKFNSHAVAADILRKEDVSPSLSLSPLGQRHSSRMPSPVTGRYTIVRSDERSLDGSFSSKLSSEEGNVYRTSQLLLDHPPSRGFSCFTADATTGKSRQYLQSSNLNSPCLSTVPAIRWSLRKSLIGSFEESLLSGRLLSGKVNQGIEGFLAVLNVTGGDFSPKVQKLPFSVSSVSGENYLLYYSSIDLSRGLAENNSGGPRMKNINSSRAGNSRLRIPMRGRIQLVLSNPEKTPIHTFFCSYDLSDMPAGTKETGEKTTKAKVTQTAGPANRRKLSITKNASTFLRQKIILTLSDSSPVMENITQTDSQTKVNAEVLHVSNDLQQSKESMTSKENVDAVHKLQHREQCLEKMKDEACNSAGDCPYTCGECSFNDTNVKTDRKLNTYESRTTQGTLRYALQLRFLCPSPKKCKLLRRCNSDPSSAPSRNCNNNEGDRRFYLYNDLRVVFPQRHSDSDEGKLCVEYHFPSDPKYFDIN